MADLGALAAGSVLIVPDLPERASDPLFVAHVGRAIDKVNGQLAQYETIKKFRVLPVQFSVSSGELTPTLKLKRRIVSERFTVKSTSSSPGNPSSRCRRPCRHRTAAACPGWCPARAGR